MVVVGHATHVYSISAKCTKTAVSGSQPSTPVTLRLYLVPRTSLGKQCIITSNGQNLQADHSAAVGDLTIQDLFNAEQATLAFLSLFYCRTILDVPSFWGVSRGPRLSVIPEPTFLPLLPP